MITKRIIPCLDVRDGRVVKGVRFQGLGDVSDPVSLARHYSEGGADKVSVNSGAIADPRIIGEAARRYGSQCVVLSVDAARAGDGWHVFAKGGRVDTGMDALEWIRRGIGEGAGELVLNSIDTDGVKRGFDLPMLQAVCEFAAVPVIASGSAGSAADFVRLFREVPGVDAGLAASIFHFGEVTIRGLKEELAAAGIHVRL